MNQYPETVLTGGLTGQGFGNLLGRPRLGVLPLTLREAVQNSWDARRRLGKPLHFRVRLRTLSHAEDREFRKIFDQSEAVEPTRKNTLQKQLGSSNPVRVLELADFGTVGLSGATRPDLPTDEENSRFVNFFFDIGRAHEGSGDGGTYGFGRSSLYTAGKASLILVDSLAYEGGKLDRRVMACRIGEAFEVRSGRSKGRYSGRHFWGAERQGIVQPVTGAKAQALAAKLGMPDRSGESETGTTILIPWPSVDFENGESISRTLLHHLWPKMVPAKGQPTIAFSVEVDGRRFEVPNPAKAEDYRHFVSALEIARTRDQKHGAREIATLRPVHITGYLGVSVGAAASRPPQTMLDDDEGDVEESPESPLNRIALMRPSELVVRYLAVSGTEQVGRAWAGVFICDNAEVVRTAFARSEPPAHDDWMPDRLDNRNEKYLVRKTVKALLPDAVRESLGVRTISGGEDASSGASLAGASARFSQVFLSGNGQGVAKEAASPRNGGSVLPVGKLKVSRPTAAGIESRGGAKVARFTMAVSGPVGSRAGIRALPAIHAEGRLDDQPEGVLPPTIVGWKGVSSHVGDLGIVSFDLPKKPLEVLVAFNGDYGLTLDCSVEELA